MPKLKIHLQQEWEHTTCKTLGKHRREESDEDTEVHPSAPEQAKSEE